MTTAGPSRLPPPALAEWIARLSAPAGERADLLADLRDELNEHAARLGPAAARRWYWRQVLRSIVPLIKRRLAPAGSSPSLERVRRGHLLSFIGHDARDALRSLLRSPVFAALVVLTLSLGIGANTAIFTVMDALLFKPLPYADADRLVRVAEWPHTGGNYTVAPAAFTDWRASLRRFSGLEARTGATIGLLEGDPEELRVARVTSGYFDLLGMRASLGRTFAEGDDRSGQPCRAVLSNRLWRRRFGEDRAVLGRALRTSVGVCTAIGVLPPDSVFDRSPVEMYLPLAMTADEARSHGRSLTVFARLAREVSLDEARAELTTVAAAFNATRGNAGRGWTAAVTPLRDVVLRSDTRQLTWVLFGAVAVVLLVACVNVASLSLSRTVDRSRELAIRAALGAGRWRLFRYLLVESLMLATAGAAGGIAIGSWALRLFLWLVPPGTLPPEAFATLDARALIFTGGLAAVTALLCGTVPAWQGMDARSSQTLASGSRSVSGSRRTTRLHSALLVAEIALAMVLVTGATLLVVSFTRLVHVNPGFRPDQVLTTRMSIPIERYPTPADASAFYERTLDAIRRLPGVERAAAVTSLPLGGWLFGTTFTIEGLPFDPERPASAHIQHVSSDYFETLGIPLLAGRTITGRDDARAPLVAVVNETFKRRFIGDRPAIGRRLTLGIATTEGVTGAAWQIIGVIGDVKTGGLADGDLATPEIYVPHTQSPMPSLFVTFRTDPAEGRPAPDLRRAVRSVDPSLPLGAVTSMDKLIGESVRTQRFRTTVMATFAGLAALLANLGVYAVRSRAIRARRREIGVRAALGATRRQILSLLLGQALRLVAAGMAIGAAGAVWSTRIVRQWLFATDATDPVLLAGAAVLLGGTALVAGWLPARRAAAIDPLISLRHE
jgi:putative ABC transport system permease protein